MAGSTDGQGLANATPEDHFAYLLARVHQRVQQAMDHALRTVDTTPTQFYALAHIAQAPGLSSADLARGLMTTPQATATLVRRLENAGLVERDTRGRGLPAALSLTSAGRAKLRRSVSVAVKAEAAALSSISPADQKRAAAILQTLLDGLDSAPPG